MKLHFLGAALVLGSLSLIGGCAKSGEGTTSNAGTDANSSTATSSVPPPSSSAPSSSGTGGAKIVYIPKNTGNAYFDPVIEGFKKASQEKGLDFTTVAPPKADASSQISYITSQIQNGVKAIAISPNSPDVLKPVLKEAMGKGIKVITVDADLTGNEDARDAAILPIDFSQIGSSQIELMSSLIGGKGDIAILSATTDAPNQNEWIKGMKKALEAPKYKGMNLVEVAYGDDDAQKSQRETEALLTKYPNLKGIISPTTVGIAAAAQALETAQAANRVQLTGLGMPDKMRKYIKDGTVKKFALWDPANMGQAGAYLAAGLIDGSIKATEGGTFKAGSLGDLKFGPKNVVTAGKILVFDSKNIDQYKF